MSSGFPIEFEWIPKDFRWLSSGCPKHFKLISNGLLMELLTIWNPLDIHMTSKSIGSHPKSLGNPLEMFVTNPLDIHLRSIRNTRGIHLKSMGSPLGFHSQSNRNPCGIHWTSIWNLLKTNEISIGIWSEIHLRFICNSLEFQKTFIRNAMSIWEALAIHFKHIGNPLGIH